LLEQVLGNCFELYMRMGKTEDAGDALRRARSAQAAQYGASLRGNNAWRVAVLDINEASGNAMRGHDSAVLKQSVSALPVLTARFGNDGFFTQKAILLVARTYQRAGNRVKAAEFRKRLSNKS
jgi:hypothetical protein